MKRLITLSILSLLAGCGILSAQFDGNEYDKLNNIYTYAEYYKTDCADPTKTRANFDSLSLTSKTLINYSHDLPDNDLSITVVTEIDELIQTSNQQIKTGTHSQAFCELKLEIIQNAAGVAKAAMAKRRR